jgi:hypothetical protein
MGAGVGTLVGAMMGVPVVGVGAIDGVYDRSIVGASVGWISGRRWGWKGESGTFGRSLRWR